MSLSQPHSAAQMNNGTSALNAIWKLGALFLLIVATATTLVGCATAKETVTTYSGVMDGAESTVTLYATGDEVTKQTVESSITYEALGVTSAAEAEELLAGVMGMFDGVEGVEHTVEYGATTAVERLTVDYKVADLSQVAGLPGSEFQGDTAKAQRVSLKQSVTQLETQGFSKVS